MTGKWVVFLFWLLGISTIAQGQNRAQEGEDTYLIYAIGYAEGCTWMDDLLRKTCARIGAHLSETNRKMCALPDRPYKERIAKSYPAFKERFRVRISELEPKIAKVLARTHADLEQQFAQVSAGKVSMLDLESLSREVGGRCVTIETGWLTQNPKSK